MQDQLTYRDRLQHAWNAFRNKDPVLDYSGGVVGGGINYFRPDRRRSFYQVDTTIVPAIYNRISTDVASARIQHIRQDDVGGFLEEMKSGLNNIFTVSANVDQSGRAFIADITQSMLDEGVVACVPIDTSINPELTGSFDILTMRTAKIVDWRPRHVKVEVYNDRNGQHEFLVMPKDKIAIIENPFYNVMNEPNSTLKRLVHKLTLLDAIDEQSSAGKLDLIIQLPYVVKSEKRKQQANLRRKEIEDQLAGSKYGIAYTDGTERITQLNRSVENNLMGQIEYLTSMLYSQLGINQEVLDGTASESTMINYYKRTVDVILNAIVDEFSRKFLTKTARSQNQAIRYFRDPFALTPTDQIADIADKFTRNEILSPNEVRGIVGFKPSMDPAADELRNRNINQNSEEMGADEEFQNEGEYLDEQEV